MRTVTFTVYGKPQPAGSKKGMLHPATGRVIVIDDAKHSRPWKQEITGAAIHAMADVDMFTGPVRLHVVFYVSRPKGHMGTGRNQGRVKASAPLFPAVKPDLTKLLRAAEDALTSVVWRDDCQVVDQRVRKVYCQPGEPERAVIQVHDLSTIKAAA